MMDEPHWLLQELAGEAVWTALLISGAWVYKNRNHIRNKLVGRNRQPVLLSGEVSGSSGMEGTLTVGSERQILYDVRALAGSERRIVYNVETPTPSLVKRLEELASWYLHVS